MKAAILALSVSLLAASAAVHADPKSGIPNLTDIAVDGGGNVIHMNQTDAAQYCQNLGDRLPTIRELALWATQYSGYKAPAGAWKYFYWSSSLVPGDSNYAYVLNGAYGYVDSGYRSGSYYVNDSYVYFAVRCVRSR